MIDLSTPRFKTSETAFAAGLQAGTLRAYFSRGHWRNIGQAAGSAGLPNLFSLRDALTFAVAARLIDAAGVHPEEAFNFAAMNFAHTGNAERGPGGLFDLRQYGETLLVYWPDEKTGQVVASDSLKHPTDILGSGKLEQDAAVVIRLNKLVARVQAALGGEGD